MHNHLQITLLDDIEVPHFVASEVVRGRPNTHDPAIGYSGSHERLAVKRVE